MSKAQAANNGAGALGGAGSSSAGAAASGAHTAGASGHGTNVSTPAPSSPPASESMFSELDGTASVLETSFGDGAPAWEPPEDSASLNIVSWKLGVDAHVEDGLDKRGFNAISTVLNHPTKRANPLRASRKPLPPLGAPPLLPKLQPPTFYDGYLKSIAPLYEQFVQSQAAAAASSGSGANGVPELDLQTTSTTAKEDLPLLDSIPDMFFESGFDIANPSVWAEVMASADDVPPQQRKGKTHDAVVQDVLSTHLDNLERHLVHEITLRSSSFFSALGNLQDLNSESTSCLTRITNLKSALGDIGGKQARKGLEIIDAQARLHSLRVTEGGVKHLAELDEMLRLARGLADGGDWAGALGCVEDIVRWWTANGKAAAAAETDETPKQPHLPLTTLPALSYLPTSIAVLTANIAGQLETALQSALQSLLSESDDATFDAEHLRVFVSTMLGGLVRCGKANALASVWREAVTTSIREGLRKHLPLPQGEEGDVERGTEASGYGLAQKLQAMSHDEFVELCKKMYSTMLTRLECVQKMGEEMATMLSETSDMTTLALTPTSDGPQLSTKAAETARFEPAETLTAACELANTRASIILSARSEQHSSLPIDQFVEVFNQSMSFVSSTEALAKRMIGTLRGAAQSQARALLQAYHQQRLTKSARLVEDETWVQVDVPAATQHAANLLVEAAISDPAECFVPPRTNGAASGEANGELTGSTKQLSVEDKTFCLVKATSESLQLLSEYLSIVINLELVATDVMTRIIEFLRSFNSRICQLVLGAGAMRSAGLKNITAKHLALASQSLSVVIALIPYIREFIRRHVNPRQAIMLVEFDKLKRDYMDHQEEIHAKLVAIMSDRLAVHCVELREIDWETAPQREGPNQYALMLVKETATLHKVLSKYLAPATVDSVMTQVISAYVSRLSDEYAKVEFKSDDAKKRMLQDAAIIAARLQPLSSSGSQTSALEALVREKPTPRRNVTQAVRGMLGKEGTAAPGEGRTSAEAKEAAANTPLPETPSLESTSAMAAAAEIPATGTPVLEMPLPDTPGEADVKEPQVVEKSGEGATETAPATETAEVQANVSDNTDKPSELPSDLAEAPPPPPKELPSPPPKEDAEVHETTEATEAGLTAAKDDEAPSAPPKDDEPLPPTKDESSPLNADVPVTPAKDDAPAAPPKDDTEVAEADAAAPSEDVPSLPPKEGVPSEPKGVSEEDAGASAAETAAEPTVEPTPEAAAQPAADSGVKADSSDNAKAEEPEVAKEEPEAAKEEPQATNNEPPKEVDADADAEVDAAKEVSSPDAVAEAAKEEPPKDADAAKGEPPKAADPEGTATDPSTSP